MPLLLENFSRDYLIAPDIEVNPYRGDTAQMDQTIWAVLREILGEPIVGKVENLHYHFEPSDQVLGERAAVPRQNHKGSDDLELLLSK